MEDKQKIDVIVIGAGPSGIACALTIAREKKKVLVIEKASDFGVKNVFGGAVYLNSIRELLPETCNKFSYDRVLSESKYFVLNNDNSICVSYKNSAENNSVTTTRYNFDTFLAEQAIAEGVYFAKNTLVVELIKKDKKVIGVRTENEEIYSDIVVIAEGFNSILAEQAGLKKKAKPEEAILCVKETIKLSEDEINTRFNIEEGKGVLCEFFGGLNKEGEEVPFGMGFLYTYKSAVSIGVGISMESLKNSKIPAYEYLERLKNNKNIKPLIENGEIIEYSAHSIPEGGYKKLPKLYDNGVLLIGDAAGFVNPVHFEGTNLAIKSGIIAGKVCIDAINKNDFSNQVLKKYKKELFKSNIIKDLKTYKSVMKTLYSRRKSVFAYYPSKIDEFFSLWTSAGKTDKKTGYKKFISSVLFNRNPIELFKDVISFIKCFLEAII